MPALTNAQLMWASLGIWLIFVLVLLYGIFFSKPATALPSGNIATGAAAAGGLGS